MQQERVFTRRTALGSVRGIETSRCLCFLGIPYARAARFAYSEPIEHWEGELDATRFGPSCPQNRAVHEHLENPTRRFYKKEYREGIAFRLTAPRSRSGGSSRCSATTASACWGI